MGGGGSLQAVRDKPSYKAAVPLAPYNLNSTVFYNSIPSSTPKAFLDWLIVQKDQLFAACRGPNVAHKHFKHYINNVM